MSDYRIETEEVRMYDTGGEGFVGGPCTRFDLVFTKNGQRYAIPIGIVSQDGAVWHAKAALIDEEDFVSSHRHEVESEVHRWADKHYQTLADNL